MKWPSCLTSMRIRTEADGRRSLTLKSNFAAPKEKRITLEKLGEWIVNYVALWKYFHIWNFYELHRFVCFFSIQERSLLLLQQTCTLMFYVIVHPHPPSRTSRKTAEHEPRLFSVRAAPGCLREAAIKSVFKSE